MSLKIDNFRTWLSAKGVSELPSDAKALAEYNAEYISDVGQKLAGAVEKSASADDIKSIQDSIQGNLKSIKDELLDIAKKQGLEIQHIKDAVNKPSVQKADSLRDMLESNSETLKAFKSGVRAENLQLKVPGSMSLSGNTTGQIPQAFRIAGANEVPQRQVRFLNLLQQGSITSNLVEWVYQANEDGTAGSTAETAAKNQIDFDLVVASQRVEKYTAYIKVTDEMITDVDYLESLINRQLSRKLLQAVESDAYAGNGTTPNLNGVRTVSTAWAAGASAASVDNANIVDVLRVGVTQILLAEQPMPDYILMNPADVLALKQIKVSTTDKRYIDALQMIAGDMLLDGIPIIQTTLVSQDDFLIGNSELAQMLTKEGISIEVGYDGNDFTTNFRTIRAEWRGVVFVQNNDRTAFVAGDFTTAKAALETP